MEDSRIEWMRERIYAGLNLTDQTIFEKLLENEKAEDIIRNFILGKYVEGDDTAYAILFYLDYVEKTREKEVEYEVEVTDDEDELGDDETTSQAMSARESNMSGLSGKSSRKSNSRRGSRMSSSKASVGRSESKASRDSQAEESISQNESNTNTEGLEAKSGDEEDRTESESTLKEKKTKFITEIRIEEEQYIDTVLHISEKKIPEEFETAPCVFFLRNLETKLPAPADITQARKLLPRCIEYGVLNQHSLVMLKQLMESVFVPFLNIKTGKIEPNPNADEKSKQSVFRDEFLLNLSKFTQQIRRTINQIEGRFGLEIPDTVQAYQTEPIEKLAQDSEVIELLENTVSNWQNQVLKAVEEQLAMQPQGDGPIAEIELWRERNAALAALLEQLKRPDVQFMLSVLREARNPVIENFEGAKNDLTKYSVEARDNVRFLQTLERHFKNLQHSNDFCQIIDTIPSMMNSLRMVWIISRHYNKDERMVPLMERIAWHLAERVKENVDLKTIFAAEPQDVKKLAKNARTCLTTWKSSYLDVRARIEENERDARWEFDKQRLFQQTDYMASICQDIVDVAQVLEEFYNIFGPELKAVTGDPKRIEEVVARVDALVKPLEDYKFDPFAQDCAVSWKKVIKWFNREVEGIEAEAKRFIDESFKYLRSAEGAFDLLLKFQHIKSRESINQQMMNKSQEIIKQYRKEVDIINDSFLRQKDRPPVPNGQPPAGGAIMWEKSLFDRIKRTIVRFMESEEMMASDEGRYVKDHYLRTARKMKQYEDELYEKWRVHTEACLPGLMRKTLLLKNIDTGRFEVNFAPELNVIMLESKYLEQLGFSIPELARNMALQEHKYSMFVVGLRNMLERYHRIMSSLEPAELDLLSDWVKQLQQTLKAGHTRLNWNTLGIKEYVNKCEKMIDKFESLVNQVHDIAADINHRVELIAMSDFFVYKSESPETPDIKDYFESVEHQRAKDVELLARKYRAIGPLLTKLEGLVVSTNSGRSDSMASYYKYWERKVYDAIVIAVVDNLENFNCQLRADKPLFRIEAALAGTEIILRPAVNETQKLVFKTIGDVIDSSRSFVRWMDGTCIETPPQPNPDSDEPYLFTFHSDILPLPSVTEVCLGITENLQRCLVNCIKIAAKWRKYSKIWKPDKPLVTEKFANKEPSCVEYDHLLDVYTKMVKDVNDATTEEREQAFVISVKPMKSSVKMHAREWISELQKQLRMSAKVSMFGLAEKLRDLNYNLEMEPDTLDELKAVLQTISNIREMSMEVEFQLDDIDERYRTLLMYRGEMMKPEEELLGEIRKIWADLIYRSKCVDVELTPIKRKFTAITLEEITDFKVKMADFAERFENEGPSTIGDDLESGLQKMKEFSKVLIAHDSNRLELANAEKLFGLEVTAYPRLVKAKTEMEGLTLIYELYERQMKARDEWAQTLWSNLNVDSLTEGIEGFLKDAKKFPPHVRQMTVARALQKKMLEFKNAIPLFVDLKNEALRDRHWKSLMDKTGKSFDMNPETFTLGALFDMGLHNFVDSINEIVTAATKELSIEKGLKEVSEVWDNIKFTISKYFKGTSDRGYVLGTVDEVIQTLDDNAMTLQSMSASRFIGPFLNQVQTWEKSLSHISEVCEIWMVVQRKWMYLESIFIGGDIRSQLPEEAKKFDKINDTFKKIMQETAKNPKIKDSCHAPNRLEDFTVLAEGLERCQKSLNDYLDSKRNAFPRFFFISDDELLSILGSSDPTCVQEHMIKMYDNIAALGFSEGTNGEKIATSMISAEKEVMDFKKAVQAEGRVEDWMTAVLAEMRATNRGITKEAVYTYGETGKRADWMFKYQGMVVLAASQIWWTWEVEDIFRKVKSGNKLAMKNYAKQLHGQIDEIVEKITNPLKKNDRAKFNTVLTIDVHARDIVDTFVRDSILDEKEFEWESQLRFYWWKPEDDVIIRQCTGEFGYGYEYMGLNGRLVITPLTDRIYLTLTQALSMYLGGAPAGPAGTGKTETTKDLAKALGLLCVVTNCGEGMDYKAVGKILSGLSQCGAWGCFDEFNRIDASVLSVVSSQVQTIRNALIRHLSRFQFEGVEISLDPRMGIFITMNPGYAGRTELPESVKALFRPVVVIVPDLQQICEIILFCEGFLTAKVLAKKMTVLYKLSKEQLSKQNHYDFGLRALRSVLNMAGNLKRGSPDLPEDMVLMRALRDMNLPKFIFEDVPLFLGLIGDLFPGLDCPRVRYPNFNDAVEVCLTDKKYILKENQCDKVVQMYETMMTRHCTMIVGPTGGGKSVVINALCQAQTRLGLPTKMSIMNPKALSVIELYGILDPVTRDWTDGVLSNIFREMNRPTEKKERRYVLFDGDVDALWIENMNSVMDDNKLLTLANGERIRLQPHCAMLFEVGDLQYASPATVSRAGMVFVDPKNLRYRPYWERWLVDRTDKLEQEFLPQLFDKTVDVLIDLIHDGMLDGKQGDKLKLIVPQTDLNMVTQLCKMLEACLDSAEAPVDSEQILEAVYVECLYWSLGGTLVEESQEQFNTIAKKLLALPGCSDSDDSFAPAGTLPTRFNLMYDYHFDISKRQWIPWKMIVPEYIHDRTKPFHEILVPTVDTTRTNWLLQKSGHINRPVSLVGESGTSKSATIQDFLRGLSVDSNLLLNINFSSRTSSMDVQRTIEANIEKRTKDIYGPPPGKRLLVFMDDMNMPQVDTYGTQQPIALMKLLLEKGYIYDRSKELNCKVLKDISYVSAMGKAGGGRNSTDPRFLSLFSVFNMTFPSDESINKIYTSILSGHLQPFHENILDLASKLTNCTLELYKKIVRDLPPTPSKFHYIFNLRDLSRVYSGLCVTSAERFTKPDEFIRVWRNECLRVFHDRAINDKDKNYLQETINGLVSKTFPPPGTRDARPDPFRRL